MDVSAGLCVFLLAPVLPGALLLWRFPRYRRFRWRSILLYLLILTSLISGALIFVSRLASARLSPREVVIVLWFTIGWRLAWELWARTVGRVGQRWVRWARRRRSQQLSSPFLIRLIPPGRAVLTITIFVPAFLSCVVTHRCKLADGQDPLSVFVIPFEQVTIPTSDGLRLDGWFIPEKGADRTIIVCHGAGANKGNFVWFLGALAHHGYNVVFFDFRAHGASDGRTTTYGIRERLDVIAVVDWLKRERPGQAKTVVGLGSSQGAMALALAAGQDTRIDAIILDSPFTSAYELAHHHARHVPIVGPAMVDVILAAMSAQTGVSFFSASATKAVASMGKRPMMVIHGDQDIGMPVSHSQELYNAATGPRELWLGPGPHSNIVTTDSVEYEKRVFAFLESSLGK
jgi:uncharacterized protein